MKRPIDLRPNMSASVFTHRVLSGHSAHNKQAFRDDLSQLVGAKILGGYAVLPSAGAKERRAVMRELQAKHAAGEPVSNHGGEASQSLKP